MAQKVVTIYVDDLTGRESDEVDTHQFSLDGVQYEIDLTPGSYDKLAKALAPFITAGRKVGQVKRVARARKAAPSGPDTAEIRAWARQHGYEVSNRGRVPASVREAYEKAH